MAVKYDEMKEATKLPDEAIISDAICSVPMPRYEPEFTGEGNRWPGVRTSMMWHPLFWLPKNLSDRYLLTHPDDPDQILETDAMWMVRVALTMEASGLYDPETGGWVDILDTVGIDIEKRADRDRIQQWQKGGVDDLLDSIDLGPYLSNSNPEKSDWALEMSILLQEDLRAGSWCLLATDLLETIDMAREARSGDQKTMSTLINIISSMSTALLSEVPDEDGGRLFDFWVEQENLINSGTLNISGVFDGPITLIEEKLEYIQDAYVDSLNLLNESTGVSEQ
jgi:hypothetical protein